MNKPLSNPATWDGVLNTIKQSGARGVTNSQIAAILGSDVTDVSSLTRLLWKATEISVRKDGMSNIYSARQVKNTGASQ